MWEKELEAAIEAGLLAKEKIMEIYHSLFKVEIKSDNSPVTIADKSADAIIREHLSKLFPTYAFLTEESDDDLSRLNNDYVWIVDPVDGTKDFIAKDDGFTTNIALSYKHEIVVGVIIIPATNDIYYATKNGGTYRRVDGKDIKIHVSDKVTNLTCLTSVFHCTKEEMQLINKYRDRISASRPVGSAIKQCEIAEGKAEITYRFSPNTKEWDIAASQIIIEEAGGLILEPDGNRMTFNRKDVYNRKGYIVVNRKENILL